jgi:dimethylargininase
MIHGLSSSGLGLPDYETALRQHDAYAAALKRCGVETVVLDADEGAPDSVFIEDTAVLCEKVAIVARPGADSRRGEERQVTAVLAAYFPRLEAIAAPGTLDGGDVLRVGDHFFIGVSARTNEAGAGQLAAILRQNGYGAEQVALRHVLHLKTGINCLENSRLLAAGEFVLHPQFRRFQVIPVPDNEAYAANALWINGRVLVAAGFPVTRAAIERLGNETIAVDVSEFRKLDGGLSCLSLRF